MQIVDGALQADGRRVAGGDRRETAVRTGEADDERLPPGRSADRHMHPARLTPEPEQAERAFGQRIDGAAPGVGPDDDPRPGTMVRYGAAGGGEVTQKSHPSSLATCWNQAASSGGKYRPAARTRAKCAIIGR